VVGESTENKKSKITLELQPENMNVSKEAGWSDRYHRKSFKA